jgi:hypothetical protein
MGRYDVIAYDSDGNALTEGDVITSDTDGIYITNGIVKYTPIRSGSSPEGQLYRWNGTEYQAALDASRGEGAFFVVGNTANPDRVTVVKATIDEVELSVEWDAWDLDTGYLGTPGLGYRDFNASGLLNYPSGSATPKYITAARVVKTAVVKWGREGVFLHWHSDPPIGPFGSQLPAQNNNTDHGEREYQLGVGIEVIWSSAGVTVRHPDFGADARWTGTAYEFNRHAWMGIDDADYAPYANADHAARQHAGYPGEQSTGPYWVAALHHANATTYPFCVYMVLRERMEFGSFQFSAGAYGQPTLHFTNRFLDASALPYRTMLFIGAFPYTSASMAAEPTTYLRGAVSGRATDDFELSGQAVLAPETTTIGEVRDRMVAALESASPVVLTHRRYVAHREEVDFRAFCEVTPGAAFRRFSIRDTLDSAGPFTTSPDMREMHTTLEVTVAYPKQGGFRDDSSTGRPVLDQQDVIRSDLHVLRTTVGIRGYAALERDGLNAAVVSEEWSVTEDEACVYSVLRLRTMYRENPL